MVELTSIEVQIFIFSITELNNKLELYTDTFHEFSFEELKVELGEVLSFSDITPSHLLHETIIIQAYRKLRSEKSSTDGCIILKMG